jgi:Leucine-rich repeat (LRR) protein
MRELIAWAKAAFDLPLIGSPVSAENLVEDRLKTVWLVVRKFLLDIRTGKVEKEIESSQKMLALGVPQLKAVVVVGCAIVGSLASFVAAVAQRGCAQDIQQADWNLLDGAIHQILKQLAKLSDSVALLELAITPLYATSVASAAFLRNYSAAQHRLEDWLGRTHRRPSVATTERDSLSLLPYSELLWSQLIQLRMSLPNESLSVEQSSVKKKASKSVKEFQWEPSESIKNQNQLLIGKLESLGIRLHYLVLWGDWMLSIEEQCDKSNQTVNRLFGLPMMAHQSIQIQPASMNWRQDFLTAFKAQYEELGARLGRPYPPPPPLSPLPLFLLHVGQYITELTMSHSDLVCVPSSMGLYFPNLTVLDLSHNHLTYLPESFQHLPWRMKFLQEFRVNNNCLDSFPDDMLSFPGGSGSLLLSSSLPQTSSSSSFPLKILDFSYNRLTCLPPLIPTTLGCLEELVLDHNSLEMNVVDMSRLAIKLPTLRRLTYDPQYDHTLSS